MPAEVMRSVLPCGTRGRTRVNNIDADSSARARRFLAPQIPSGIDAASRGSQPANLEGRVVKRTRWPWQLPLVILLSGCTATTTMSGAQGGTTVAVKKTESTAVPRTETLTTTSFGNYEFKAETPGYEPFTGILPLKFNGGYLALDILFFAPAMFFNLREPYRYYEFDLENRIVRYRSKENKDWAVYAPTSAEAARGKAFFEAQDDK